MIFLTHCLIRCPSTSGLKSITACSSKWVEMLVVALLGWRQRPAKWPLKHSRVAWARGDHRDTMRGFEPVWATAAFRPFIWTRALCFCASEGSEGGAFGFDGYDWRKVTCGVFRAEEWLTPVPLSWDRGKRSCPRCCSNKPSVETSREFKHNPDVMRLRLRSWPKTRSA